MSDRCKEATKEYPIVAFRRPKALKDYPVRARIQSDDKTETSAFFWDSLIQLGPETLQQFEGFSCPFRVAALSTKRSLSLSLRFFLSIFLSRFSNIDRRFFN